MNERNEKLLKWAGFKRVEREFASALDEPAWEYPNGEWDLERDIPDFTSLDACFKWLVEKACNQLADKDISTIDEAYAKLFQQWIEQMTYKQPALALCLAIEKLIDGGGE